MQLNPGDIVDRYRIEALLGEGGMARVYQVRHLQLDSVHALKLLTTPKPAITQRLVQEGRVQARLKHRNVVSVTDTVRVDQSIGLVMEFVRGPSLAELLAHRRLTVEQADALAIGILSGVSAAHAHGMIHRDLKPANVMLAMEVDGLVPKVTDFGLAKILEADGLSNTKSGMTMGTPSYMAPEQIDDASKADERADVFSLGAILYELLTGERAFDGGSIFEVFKKIGDAEFVPIEQQVPDLPDRMRYAIEGALRVERDERVQTVRHLTDLWEGRATLDNAAATPLMPSRRGPFDDEFMAELGSMSSGTHSVPPGSGSAASGGLGEVLGAEAAVTSAETSEFDFDSLAIAPPNETMVPAAFDPSESDDPLPAPIAPPLESPARRSRLPLLLVAVGLLCLAGLGFAGTAGLAWWLWPAPEPLEAPDPVGTPGPEPVAAPEPEPVAAPEPEPVAAPEPEPVAAPEPEPVAAPEPAAAPVNTAIIRVEGDVERVYLTPVTGGTPRRPGEVAPGRYVVSAVWDRRPEPVTEVEVEAGDTRTLTCRKALRVCR